MKFKTDYRHILLALRADIKTFGGYTKAAEKLNVTHDTLCSQVNPDNDVNPPTLANFIELINSMNAKRTVAALASLVDQVTVDEHVSHDSMECEIQTFLSLIATASDLIGTGSRFAEDRRFDAREREQLLPLLMSVIQVSGHLYRKLNK